MGGRSRIIICENTKETAAGEGDVSFDTRDKRKKEGRMSGQGKDKERGEKAGETWDNKRQQLGRGRMGLETEERGADARGPHGVARASHVQPALQGDEEASRRGCGERREGGREEGRGVGRHLAKEEREGVVQGQEVVHGVEAAEDGQVEGGSGGGSHGGHKRARQDRARRGQSEGRQGERRGEPRAQCGGALPHIPLPAVSGSRVSVLGY